MNKPAGGISAQKRELLALLLRKEGIRQVEEDRIPPRAPGPHAPVSFSQQPLWFLDQLEPGSALYNITNALRLNGPLDPAALRRTLAEIAARHEAFRTSFAVVDGEPVQVVADSVEVELPLDDLSAFPEPQRGEELRRRVAASVRAPFDLARAPLLHARLFRVTDTEHVLALSMHHIVSDGWSMGIFARELGELYQAFSAGLPSPLPPVPLQYGDFAAWQRRRLAGKTLDDLLAYWRRQMEGAPALLELPLDRPRPPIQRFHGESQRFILSHRVMEGVRELNRREGTTLFMALLAVWDVLLARLSGQDHVVVGSPIANRTRKELEGAFGFFVNTLVLHADLSGDPTFREALRRVRETTLGGYAHQELPFERLVEELAPERSLSHTPVFQVMFVVQNAPMKPVQLSGLALSPVDADSGMSAFDISLFVEERSNGIHAVFRYNPDLFDAATLRRMGAQFQVLAEAAVADPDLRLSDLPVLTPAERAQLLVEWNRTERALDPRPVHEHVAERARLEPAAPAVAFRGATLSYAELDRRADVLARTLRERGAGPETRVAILLERSPEMVVAVLAVLKAGAAYVPLDPGYPAERVAYVLEDSGAALLISADGVADTPHSPAPSPTRREGEHDDDASEGEDRQHGDSPPPERGRVASLGEPGGGPAVHPESAAYVIYTSGSTGRPKGVVVPHRALANYTEHARAEYGIGAEDRVLQFASLVFDASAEEIFPALAAGAALVLRTPEMIDSPAAFAAACTEWGITVASLPTAYWHELAAAPAGELPALPDALRLVVIGGERALPERLEAWRARFGTRVRLVNTYGPTEATIVATLADVAEPEPADPVRAAIPEMPLSPVPIGRPVSNARAYVLDAHLRPVPVGVAGELLLGGAGVARGYLGRPELTAEKFVPDALSGEGGARLYRTGDRVRRRPDGRLEFLGRTDAQVKVRGFRIEPGEVEAELARHPALRECAVVAREDEPGAVRLVAYVAPADGAQAPDAAELRRFLGASLPAYMVPAAFVALDTLPLTASGKLDRRALPAPDGAAVDAGEAPRTPVEEIVAGIFAEVLKRDRVGIHEGFFDLGGHSLLATQAMSRLRAALHVDLPLRVLFEAPTVAALARRVEAALPDAVAVPPILPAPRGGELPLSFAQERLWFLDHLEPGSPFYNIPGAVRLRGPLDAAALKWALGEIVRRHEALRTVFPERGGRAAQVVLPPAPFALPVEDLRDLPEEAREAAVRGVVDEEVRHAFDLARGPLLRARLLRAAEDEHVLVLVMHHVVSDAWSMGIFFGELGEAYRARLAGREPVLAPLPVQYADFAVWQRAWLTGETLERQLGWWRDRLRGAPAVLELPTDRPRPAVQRFHGASHVFSVPEAAASSLRALGRREGATPFMVLLAAFQLLLARYSGQDDVVVGTPIAGRNREETERLIGFFVNTLALRTELWDDPTFRDLVARVRETTLGAYQHQDLPFERLVEELQPERSLSRTPLFQVMFVFQNVPPGGLDLGGVAVEPLEFEFRSEKFDLTLTMLEHPDGLLGGVQYSTDLFDAATIERMSGHLVALLGAAAEEPARPVSELRLLGEAERSELVAAAGGTRSFPVRETLHGRFAAAAVRAPEAVAVTLGAESLTYREVERRAARLGRELWRRGVGPEVRVGLCLERSAEMVVAILGVLKAGGAYVPIDPAYPADRIAYLLEDSGVSLVLAQEATRAVLPEVPGVEVVALDSPHPPAPAPTRGKGEHEDDTPEGEARQHGDSPPPERGRVASLSEPGGGPAIDPAAAAYVIYTSGSTGRPKGVVVTHANVLRLFDATQEWFGFGAEDVWTLFHSYAFDFSVWEMWGALLHGGRLVVVPWETSRDPEAFRALLGAERVTVLNQTPSAFRQLVRADETAPADAALSLRWVVFGGEALEPRTLKPWMERHGDARPRLVNMYGITETTVHVTYRPVTAEDAESAPGSVIGEGIPDLRVHLLDRGLEPVPPGVPGEMYVGGGGVARGYLGRPELTAERFVPDPYSAEPGARMYRSGDRARRRAGGGLEYLGRADQQVKVRGFRIEPGEVEAALLGHAGVREALVMAREDEPGARRLVAYVVADAAAGEPTVEGLRAHLAERLPEHMVPAAFVLLDGFPLTPHGKTDRRALPPPDGARPELGAVYAPPRDAVEAALAEVWAETLGVDRVGVHDNYFALGGDSIRSLQVLAKARERGIGFGLQDVFRYQTVAELAPHVRAERREAAARAEPFSLLAPEDRARVPEGVEDAYPMTRLQLGMIFHTEQNPDRAVYQNVNTFHLRGAFDEARLRGVLTTLAGRHAILRTSFDLAGFSEPMQLVHREPEVALETADVSGLPPEAQDAAVDAWVETETFRAFDWRVSPLIRFHAHVRGPDAFQLGFTEHHSILDGWSVAALLAELFGLYFAAGDGDGEAAAPASTFRDFVALEREALASPEAREFWAGVLEDAEPTVPPSLAPAGEAGARAQLVELLPELVDALGRVARRAGATFKSVLLAAHLRALGAAAGADDVTVGIVSNGRPEGGGGERVLGLFLNTLPLRLRPGRGSWLDLVRAAFDAERRTLPFRRFPVAELKRMNGGEPPFEVLFNFVHFHVMDSVAAAEGGRFVNARATGTTNFPLGVTFSQGSSRHELQLAVEYDATRFSDAQAERLLAAHLAVLERMAADPEARHDTLDLLPPEERRRVLAEWSDTARAYPADALLHDLFAAAAARTPGAPAVSFHGRTLTYAELGARADSLALRLRALGVGPESVVGVCLARTPELVAALLGVLRAGGAYLPLDPAYPADRLAYMLADSGARVLLTQESLAGLFGDFAGEIVALDGTPLPPAPSPAGREGEHDVHPDNPAYLIYTSGSTGRPKGVAIPHRAAAVFVHWMRDTVTDEERAGVLASTSVSFDVSVAEIFGTLCWGGRLVLVENALELASLSDADGVRLATMVPTAAAELLRSGGIPRKVRAFNLAGEPLPADLARGLYALGHVERVRNLYGPTEDTAYSTWTTVEPGAERVTIGRPVAGTRAYVLDAELRPVPVGAAGELYLAGAGLARGYHARPELTAALFRPDPFAAAPGGRMYRTLDRARWNPAGELEYLGRVDTQVKVRGVRVELGEVEAVLREHPAVADAAAMILADGAGGRLVAWVVPAEDGPVPGAAALRGWLRERLPEPMVPSAFVELDALPRTPSGKTDRRALPAPAPASGEDTYVAPRTATEERIAIAWADVLRVERVGVDDSFFDLGGHSLLATQAMSRLRAALHVDLPLRVLFEAPTVAALARRVEAALPDAIPVPPILPAPRGGELPLSFAQERLWFLDQLEPGSPFYNIPGAVRLRGPLDAAALEWALGEIVRRHEALRTVFPERGGRAAQVVLPPEPLALPVEDLSDLPEEAREAAVRGVVDEEVRHAFDLARGPLLRARLLRAGEDEHVLVLVMHHVVSDAWSMGIFFGELGEAYRARLAGREPVLAPLPVQYADFAVWQRAWLTGEVLERQLGWWRDRLRGAPAVLELPTDRPRPAVQRFHGASHVFSVPEAAASSLRALGRREGATPFMVLLAAFQLLLARYSGQDDVVVGTPIAGRNREETERLIGFFVNTLALRTELWDDPTFRDLVARVRETTLGAYQHQDLPFERLVEELQPERSLSRTPLFQVMFVFQNVPPGGLDLGGVAVEPLEFEFRSEKFDLTLTMLEHPDGLLGGVQYSTDLFDAATIERMSGHLVALLSAAAAEPARPVSELRLLGEAERAELVAAAGGTRSFAVRDTLHGRFAAAASRAPEAVAVTLGAESLTYREVERRAAGLGRELRRRGVGPEVRVGLCLERSAEMVVAILGVLKAGGAYVPIDPAYPADRIGYLLEDSGVSLVLAQEATRAVLPEVPGVEVVALDSPHPPAPAPTKGKGEHDDDTPEGEARQHGGSPPPERGRVASLSEPGGGPAIDPDSAAYVIYTSGSTGRPKGVVVTHANVLRLFDATQEWFGFGAEDVWTLFHSYAFDFSVWEMWGALLHGGRLVVVPWETSRDPEAFRALLGAERVTVLNQTPSAFRQLVRADEAASVDELSLRWVVFGGEALEPRTLKPWMERHGDARPRLVNMYGITETTVHVTYRPVTAEDAESAPGSVIGEGIPDLRVHLLDRSLEPVPPGVPGEMYVGGGGVARGYLGRPELTAERFVPDPYSAEPGARMYRSGDRARRRAGGGLEYLGRADQQVKVRGFRIEPGEVEAALLGHAGVREALVMAREDEPGARRLVAYVVADAAAGEPTVEGLRAHLAERLPEHMVPAAFVLLDGFPLTPHGKTDRRALPAPETGSAEDTYVAPRTPTEERLAAAWAEVLRAGRVGVHDSFFDLGGHSMLATQVVSRVRHAFGVELRVADLFDNPTVEALARRVDGLLAAGSSADQAGPIARQARRGVARRNSPQ